MIVYLYLEDKFLKFYLPNDIQGSYTFDEFETEEDKLINIEERDGKWVLYSTNSTKITSGISTVASTILKSNSFYVLQRNEKKYLIYVTNSFNDNYILYNYQNDLNLVIGNSNDCNINYPVSILNNLTINIHYNENNLILEKSDNRVIYVNNLAMLQSKYNLHFGDEIEIYGLKISILKNMIMLNNPNNTININLESCHIIPITPPQLDQPKNIEIKDIDLYNENDYYQKSPRIRRLIETKEIQLTSPPNTEMDKEMPLILTVGPMLAMGLVSFLSVFNVISRIITGETTAKESMTTLLTSGAMLLSMMLWPLITRFYNSHVKRRNLKYGMRKYNKYLEEKRIVLETEEKLQREILNENLISIEECVNIINNKSINFWDKRIDQNDFLTFRVGKGDEKLDVDLKYQEEEFSLEHNKLKKKIEALVHEFEYIRNVPIGYSFSENYITAILGKRDKCVKFMDNILLQLLTFYTYEDVKVVLFTDNEKKDRWEYIKYLNHNFDNARDFRFFATDYESAKTVTDYLSFELNNRMTESERNSTNFNKPHYFIVVDGYNNVKHFEFIKQLTELDENIGFSLAIIEEKLGNLPSKCNNFISVGQKTSGILKNSYEKQEQKRFNDEINSTINMMDIAKKISNIPIEFEDGMTQLPEAISFLEMEKVGKVEQLNILNRWNQNDSTTSLKAEVGVDENGEFIYLDLHEKYHGPHGLIAGTTGSGKSEFIITYILSLSMNYSPDDVEFILIDYKGGGLAFAFENQATGVSLPHLAGTITNLDKAEMDRTLVSINSELQRRQKMFNEARDILGESTIDIYKYQRYYQEGRLEEPIPHLFIICDEFAELKSQQPDFMDNLISVARIGRSLGVHLILATQKPSGVVNDQIWSNTKFRVCLKVQDAADSKEMLKRPDAAALKEAGRFYLQVGYDELFVLGQSGWCGAKYFPSDKIVKQVDKSINFINDFGGIIKSIEAGNGNTVQAQGEQLASIMNNIIEVSNMTNKRVKRLWLENIPSIILESNLKNKYNVEFKKYNPMAILGEYDAPENQEQGIVLYDFLKQGNAIIYGIDGSEREFLLDVMIYSSTKNYSSEELNYYIIDYGSESLRKYTSLPHIGGIVYAGEEEKYNNLLKMIREELQKRKRLFADYGGEYINYIENSNDKLPIYAVILNNYDSIYDENQNLYEDLPELTRDSERYGIIFIVTANAINSVSSKATQNFNNTYALKLKDSTDYAAVFDTRTKLVPRDIKGRGIININGVHEFQTASIVDENTDLNKFIIEFVNEQKAKNKEKVHKIPTLPDIVRFDDISPAIKGLNSVPIGVDKKELNICSVDFISNIGNIITSNKLVNTEKFVKSLLQVFKNISGLNIIVFDVNDNLKLDRGIYPNYFNSNMEECLKKVDEFVGNLVDSNSTNEGVVLIYGIDKFVSKLDDIKTFENFVKKVKKYEHISIIIVDDVLKIKNYNYENWFKNIFNLSDGIWIGRGISDQSLIRVSSVNREMMKDIKSDMGYYISEGAVTLCRFIDFITEDEDEK